jgi:hypothetical protein
MKHRRPRPLATPFARAVAAVGLAALPGACGEPPGEVVFGVRSELAPGPSFTRLDARVSVNGVEVQSQSFEGAALDFPMELETGELEPETPVSVELVAIQGLVPILTKTGSTTVPRESARAARARARVRVRRRRVRARHDLQRRLVRR